MRTLLIFRSTIIDDIPYERVVEGKKLERNHGCGKNVTVYADSSYF